jgi:hypothetical protein
MKTKLHIKKVKTRRNTQMSCLTHGFGVRKLNFDNATPFRPGMLWIHMEWSESIVIRL